MMALHHAASGFFFFNDPATTEIYTLSLHDALPIWLERRERSELCILGLFDVGIDRPAVRAALGMPEPLVDPLEDRKSTRLNSSHGYISYAVFCLKKKKSRMDNLEHLLHLVGGLAQT